MKFMLNFVLSIFLAVEAAKGATNQKQIIDEEWETFKVSKYFKSE